jgi:hypothetical protein
MRWRRRAIAVGAIVICGVMTGCTPVTHVSTAAPAVVYCGQTLFSSDTGIYTHLAPPRGTFAVPSVWLHSGASSLPIAIQLTSDCSAGDTVSVAPAGVIRIAKTALASNGKPVGLLIYCSRAGTATITATDSTGATADIVLVVKA